jgi:hypothetical protein
MTASRIVGPYWDGIKTFRHVFNSLWHLFSAGCWRVPFLFVGLAQMTDLADDVRARLFQAAGVLTNAARLPISDPHAINVQITIAMTTLESVQRLLRTVMRGP